MNMSKLKDKANLLLELTKKYSPELLTGTAIVGLIGTTVMAYRCSPKAHAIIEKKREDEAYIEYCGKINPDQDQVYEKKAKRRLVLETVKELTPVLLPPVILGTATTACIIGSNRISSKRIAVISTAYAISEKAVKELNLKMNDVLGEKKAKTIKDAIVKDKLDKNPPPKDESQILLTGNGDVLCMDSFSGRYFRSNAEKIGQAINELSALARDEMYVTLNDFYYAIHLPQLKMGDDLGWSVDDEIKGSIPITISAQLTEDRQPCLCIDYEIRPLKEGY